MIVELIYTSAPETLDGPGYGVVAKSADLPGHLERFLRQLNRYDFDLSQGREGPAVFSHAISRDGPESWHVLSRIGFGGYDYTQRAVFLAHHVALTADELRDVRAADLLRSPSLFKSRWEGPSGPLPRRSIPAPSRGDRGRELWKSVAGHPDWSRAWVDRWSQQGGQPCFLVTPPGADVPGLFAGASSLLEPDEANRIGLLTHMDSDRAGVRYDWIGLTAGSKVARSVASRFPDRTMDLGRPLAGSPPAPVAPRHPTTAHAAPPPPAPGRPRSPIPSVATVEGLEDDWTYGPTTPVGSRKPGSRPSTAATLPPPPPPQMIAGGWARHLMIPGAIVLVAALSGSAWWIVRNGRAAPKPPEVAAKPTEVAVVPSSSNETGPDGPSSGRRVRPPRPDPITPPGDGGGREVPRSSEIAEIVARKVEPRHLPPFRPDGRWPLQDLISKPKDPVKVVEVDGADYSQIQLLTPRGSALKWEKVEEKDNILAVDVVSRPQSGNGPEERVRLSLSRPTLASRRENETTGSAPAPSPAGSAAIKARLLTDSAPVLLEELPLCLLRLKVPRTESAGEQIADVYFAPVLPPIPLEGVWDCGDESMTLGAKGFFIALHKATHPLRDENRLSTEFLKAKISLSILPGEAGWELKPGPGDPWIPGKDGRFPFKVARRDDEEGDSWPFVMTLSTNFDRANVSPTQSQPAIAARVEKVVGAPEPKPEGNAPTPAPGKAVSKSGKKGQKPKNPKQQQPKAQPNTPQREEADLLSEMFRRFGLVSGSIAIPVATDGHEETIDVLIFDEVPSAPTQSVPGVGATHGP